MFLRQRAPIRALFKSFYQEKVTCNGPFVEFPTISTNSKLGGPLLIDLPQSATVNLSSYAIAGVKGDLNGLINRKITTDEHTYNKVRLSTPTILIAQTSVPQLGPISLIEIKSSQHWVINGVKNLLSWSDVTMHANVTGSCTTLSVRGFFALRPSTTAIKLGVGQNIQLMMHNLLATNAQIELVVQKQYSDTIGVDCKRNIRGALSQLISLVATKSQKAENSPKPIKDEEFNSSKQIEIYGPGIVLLSCS